VAGCCECGDELSREIVCIYLQQYYTNFGIKLKILDTECLDLVYTDRFRYST
jgi:hypothetical protein